MVKREFTEADTYSNGLTSLNILESANNATLVCQKNETSVFYGLVVLIWTKFWAVWDALPPETANIYL